MALLCSPVYYLHIPTVIGLFSIHRSQGQRGKGQGYTGT